MAKHSEDGSRASMEQLAAYKISEQKTGSDGEHS
jgi:hypothetical protein